MGIMDIAQTNYYSVLGVKITASNEEIRESYRRLARLYHPDKCRGNLAAKEQFQKIQEAYAVLSDNCKRRQYDLGLLHLLDYEDYLERFQEFTLTVNGLGMGSPVSTKLLTPDEEAVVRNHAKLPLPATAY